MTTTYRIPVSELKVCSICDVPATFVMFENYDKPVQICPECDDYKHLVTVEEWEDMNGEPFDAE